MNSLAIHKVLQWLLNSINPELFEIGEIVSRMGNRIKGENKISAMDEIKIGSGSLTQLLDRVIQIESQFIPVAKNLISPWKPPITKSPVYPYAGENIESVITFPF